jgi:hypothetical protein
VGARAAARGSFALAALVVVAALVVTAAVAVAGTAWAVEIVQETDEEIVLRVRLKDFELREIESRDGVVYTTIRGSDLVTLWEAGRPNIPGYSYTIAVPEGGHASVVSVEGSYEIVARGVRIVPVESIDPVRTTETGLAAFEYVEDAEIYDAPGRFPDENAWLEAPGRFRRQDIVRAVVSPFHYEPATGNVFAARELTVRIRFEGSGGSGLRAADEGSWERTYEKVLVNYEQGRRWRVSERKLPDILRQPAGNDRFKILVSETGIYTVDYAALNSAGFPSGVAVDDIFIYRDEFKEGDPDTIESRESHILLNDENENGVFDGADYILFYALDFYGQFGARWSQDRFFDKNVYWVSWADGEHARMSSVDGWPDMADPERPGTYAHLLHFEEDLDFCTYPPHEVADYYWWARSFDTAPYETDFEVPGIDETQSAELRANFIGYTNDGRIVTDDVLAFITSCAGGNPVTVGTGSYSFPGMRNFTWQLDPGDICEGTNTFAFRTSLSYVYSPGSCLDWYEVTYHRRYEAYQDLLEFTNGDSLGEIEIEVSDFSSPDISLFDVTDPVGVKLITVPGERIVEEGGVFSLTFRDSISDTTSYIAVTPAAMHVLGSGDIEKTTAPLLRNEPGNYLVISHPDFEGALQPLVDLREAQGHAVILATTEQVYDDFNNGMKSDEAIKRYIENAYFTRDADFVLLVGDANVDRRGILVDIPPSPSDVDYLPSHSFRIKEGRAGYNWELRADEGWFACADGPEDKYPDVYIGRLPVDTYQEADGAVDKILAYESYEGGDPWKKRVLLVADDRYGDSNMYATDTIWYTGQTQFMAACDSLAIIAADSSVVAPDTVKYYLERCTKDDQPEKRCGHSGCGTEKDETWGFTEANCTPELRALMNSGALMMNFQGHANEGQFCHEFLLESSSRREDVLSLSNADKPFVLFGYGCWISNFDRRLEAMFFIGEAIGEKFVKNPGGGACASLASACSEYISTNEDFNAYVAHALFDYLTPYDRQGNPLEARVLLGEAVLTALLRYNSLRYLQRQILFGDPAMIIDMGPPHIATTVNDSLIDESYVFAGDEPDTLHIISEIMDEEAINLIGIDLIEGENVTPVPGDEYTETALLDTGFVRARAYEVEYTHVPGLGNYAVRITGTDYAGHDATSEFEVATGGAEYYKDSAVLEEGGTVVIDQTLRVVLSRPVAFDEEDIVVKVDTTDADEFDEYRIEMTDVGGREYEVSFLPALDAGEHTILASVHGFESRRGFVYIPGDIDFFVDGRPLYENDFVSAEPVLEALVKGTTDPEEVGVTLDGEEPDSIWYAPDTSSSSITVGLTQELDAGDHTLEVTVDEIGITRNFRVSDEFSVTEVSAYPVPFGDFTYIYYTLTSEATEVRFEVFTVAGRKIYEDRTLTPYAGYNIYRWDGRDSAGDEIANGTYIYRLVVKSGSREREFTAPIARLK